MARSFFLFLFPDREPKFPDGALFMPIESDRISLVKRKDKTNSRARPRLILLREFSGYGDMRSVIEQALEALILEKYDDMLLQKAS